MTYSLFSGLRFLDFWYQMCLTMISCLYVWFVYPCIWILKRLQMWLRGSSKRRYEYLGVRDLDLFNEDSPQHTLVAWRCGEWARIAKISAQVTGKQSPYVKRRNKHLLTWGQNPKQALSLYIINQDMSISPFDFKVHFTYTDDHISAKLVTRCHSWFAPVHQIAACMISSLVSPCFSLDQH